LLDAIGTLDAGTQLRFAHGAALGIGLAFNGDDNSVTSAGRALSQRAFPERFD